MLHGLVSLARPLNCVVSFVAVTAACVIAGADTTDVPRIAIAASAAVLLGASGNVINDVFDVAIDRVNKPYRAIAAGTVSRRTAIAWAVLCAATGLTLSVPLGQIPLLIATGSVAAMYAYSAWLKRLPLIGNLAVSVIIGTAFIYGAAAFGNAGAGIVPALLAFGFNLAREVLKDVEDILGDALHGARTFPVIAGERAALLLVSVLLVALLAGTAAPYVFSIYSEAYIWVVLFGVDTVLIYVLFAMWNDRTQGNIARLNVLLKYDMLMGIIAIVAGTR